MGFSMDGLLRHGLCRAGVALGDPRRPSGETTPQKWFRLWHQMMSGAKVHSQQVAYPVRKTPRIHSHLGALMSNQRKWKSPVLVFWKMNSSATLAMMAPITFLRVTSSVHLRVPFF
jgi:hypothetical protein